jgi:hypothetical protein
MGLPFRSGHYLAMRHIPASSIGPEYRTVWHYAPDGTCTFITDRRPEHTCARHFAPGDSALTLYAIASKWDGPHSLRVTVPNMLDWRIELGSTSRYGDDDRIVTPAPPNRLAQQCFSAGGECGRRSAVAGWTRRYERHSTQRPEVRVGTAANLDDCEQPRRSSRRGSRPATSATPDNYTSSISGYAKRGLFAVGDSAFENFDPTQHALPSAPKVKSQTGRKDS